MGSAGWAATRVGQERAGWMSPTDRRVGRPGTFVYPLEQHLEVYPLEQHLLERVFKRQECSEKIVNVYGYLLCARGGLSSLHVNSSTK